MRFDDGRTWTGTERCGSDKSDMKRALCGTPIKTSVDSARAREWVANIQYLRNRYQVASLFACQIHPCTHTNVICKVVDAVARPLQLGLLSDRHHMNPKWMAEIEPARAQTAAEPAQSGSRNMGTAQMKALSRKRASSLQTLLNWSADLVSRTAAYHCWRVWLESSPTP